MHFDVHELSLREVFGLVNDQKCPFLVPKTRDVYEFWDEEWAQRELVRFLHQALTFQAVFGGYELLEEEETETDNANAYARMAFRRGDEIILFSPVTLEVTVVDKDELSIGWYMPSNPGLTGEALLEALPEEC